MAKMDTSLLNAILHQLYNKFDPSTKKMAVENFYSIQLCGARDGTFSGHNLYLRLVCDRHMLQLLPMPQES